MVGAEVAMTEFRTMVEEPATTAGYRKANRNVKIYPGLRYVNVFVCLLKSELSIG